MAKKIKRTQKLSTGLETLINYLAHTQVHLRSPLHFAVTHARKKAKIFHARQKEKRKVELLSEVRHLRVEPSKFNQLKNR